MLKPLPIQNRPFESIAMNFMISLPQSRLEKYNTIFMIIDRLSKVASFVPTKTDADAMSTTVLFLELAGLESNNPIALRKRKQKAKRN